MKQSSSPFLPDVVLNHNVFYTHALPVMMPTTSVALACAAGLEKHFDSSKNAVMAFSVLVGTAANENEFHAILKEHKVPAHITAMMLSMRRHSMMQATMIHGDLNGHDLSNN